MMDVSIIVSSVVLKAPMEGALHFIKCLLNRTEGVVGIFVNVLLRSDQVTLWINAVIWVQSSGKSQEKVMLDVIEWIYFTREGHQKKVEFLQWIPLDCSKQTTSSRNGGM